MWVEAIDAGSIAFKLFNQTISRCPDQRQANLSCLVVCSACEARGAREAHAFSANYEVPSLQAQGLPQVSHRISRRQVPQPRHNHLIHDYTIPRRFPRTACRLHRLSNNLSHPDLASIFLVNIPAVESAVERRCSPRAHIAASALLPASCCSTHDPETLHRLFSPRRCGSRRTEGLTASRYDDPAHRSALRQRDLAAANVSSGRRLFTLYRR